MEPARDQPEVFRTPAAEQEAEEARKLDEALEIAAKEIADSLRREESQQCQRRLIMAWIPIAVLGLIAIIVGFSLSRSLRDSPSRDNKINQFRKSPPVAYTLRLPRGFEWQVGLIDLGDGYFELASDRNLNCLGIYALRNGRLVMEQPVDPRLTEFQWEKVNEEEFVLVEQPPAAKTGSNYLGATLKRNAPQ